MARAGRVFAAVQAPPRKPVGRFVSDLDGAKNSENEGFVSPNETKGFALLVVSR